MAYANLADLNHGRLLLELDRYEEAETALLEAHGSVHDAFGDEDRRSRAVVEMLVDLYRTWGRPAEATRCSVRLETNRR